MSDLTTLVFTAQPIKVQTLADGGWRVTIDGGADTLAAAATLMAMLQSVCEFDVTELARPDDDDAFAGTEWARGE